MSNIVAETRFAVPERISRIYVFPRTVDGAHHANSSPVANQPRRASLLKPDLGAPLGPHVPELIPERPSIILKPAVIKLDGQFHPKTSNAAIVRDA